MPTLFVDQLTVIDFSYVHASRGILGESWIVDIEIGGDLDDQGMIFDFGNVKKRIKQAIDEHYDHKLWIPSELPKLLKTQHSNNHIYQWQDTQQQNYSHSSPPDAIVEVSLETITIAGMEKLIAEELQQLLPQNVHTVELTLRQEEIAGASYQYSHGLQQHEGNCQRIAHGHRSALKIYKNGVRDEALEQQWALKWRDIYLGTSQHIQDSADTSITFSYQAPQGHFELTLPADRCYLLETESTVEHIAEHIAAKLGQQEPNSTFRVKAFEGVSKGAIAQS